GSGADAEGDRGGIVHPVAVGPKPGEGMRGPDEGGEVPGRLVEIPPGEEAVDAVEEEMVLRLLQAIRHQFRFRRDGGPLIEGRLLRPRKRGGERQGRQGRQRLHAALRVKRAAKKPSYSV